ATFDFASKLRLDTFAFNRLCVYRGTPLWQEYLKRGLVDDAGDWYKYFKCSEIDPTCLPGAVINAERTAGFRRLFRYKLTHYPLQTLRLLRRFMRHMPVRDVLYLIVKPFLGSKQGPTKNEVLSRAVEHATLKDAAAALTRLPDALLEDVMRASQAERRRLEAETEATPA
ncbi:MAG TPA: radical SAM protein, partial [Candidatus Kryptonia bacterium]|nr:radical SAM protein [Candidatus Kryptonia bacterium]